MVVPLQKGRLGRGLASLIGETPQTEPRLPVHGEQRLIPIEQLHPSGLNPRKDFDNIEMVELAQSIRTKGLVQPIIARPDRERGGYEIVAGERRWRAAQKAPLHQVPVIVRELSDQDVAEFAVIENVQRKDLNAMEEAAGYNELIERFNYTQEEVAEVVGKSRSHLANTLRLLKLSPRSRRCCGKASSQRARRARSSGVRMPTSWPIRSSVSISPRAMSKVWYRCSLSRRAALSGAVAMGRQRAAPRTRTRTRGLSNATSPTHWASRWRSSTAQGRAATSPCNTATTSSSTTFASGSQATSS